MCLEFKRRTGSFCKYLCTPIQDDDEEMMI